jgi:hypothetical protein
MSTQLKRVFIIGLSVFLLAGCATVRAATPKPSPTSASLQIDNPDAPQAGDKAFTVDTVEFVSAEVTNLENSPVQVQLTILYRLPTPCHQTRITVSQPDSNGRINIEMYSLMKPNTACTLMALATPLQTTLKLGNIPAGHYTIYINNAKAAEFVA